MYSMELTSDTIGRSTDLRLETDIKLAELGLGIVKDADRLQEAMLLVDRPFLDGAAVADSGNKHPERAFGHAEWLSHLKARLQARDYGDRSLTVEFMCAIHAAYASAVDPSQAGELLPEGYYISGSSIDRTLGLVAMTGTSIKAVRANPYVTFNPASMSDISKGWLMYGYGMNAQTRHKALGQICDWYNDARQIYTDRILLAAQLQRRIVALHPFPLGINGRPSRVLMNWSLENSRLPASAPSEFDDDVLVSLSQWRHEVAMGINHYRRAGQLGMIGCKDAVELYDLQEEKRYYWQTLRHRTATPAPLAPGMHHDKNDYRAFMAMLRHGSSMASHVHSGI